MRSPRVTSDADESMPLDSVPEADRLRVAEKKLWRVRSILQTDLRVAADYLDELQRYEAWRLFKCDSMAELVEQRGLRLDEELVATIRSRLQPAATSSEAAAATDAVEEPAAGSRPRVLNLRHHELGDAVYVGRANPRRGLAGSAFGNPYLVGRDGTREQVIELYRQWLLGQPALLDRLHELRGRRLACWCSPDPCHADVLAELVDADALLDELKAAGVAAVAKNGKLRLSPASRVDAAVLTRARPLKAGLLAILAVQRATRRPLEEHPLVARAIELFGARIVKVGRRPADER
jgi:hypothetical protein